MIASSLSTLLVGLGGLVFCAAPAAPPEPLFDTAHMSRADELIDQAVSDETIPGAVLLVHRRGQTVYRKAYGQRALQPERVAMTADTIFDMASVSKVVGAATSVMLLIERGQVNLTDRVEKFFPAFGANGKDRVTVEQLLLHRGGLTPDNSLKDYTGTPAESIEKILALGTLYPPGSAFRYTDVGYIMLGELVREVSGRPLDQFAAEEIFAPLRMSDTAYNPPAAWRDRIAPTEQRDGKWIVGEVHDPRAYALGGVAGHAGLFSTADDLARWCRMILNGGTLDGVRVMGPLTIREMTRGHCLPDGSGCRGYGFDVDTGYSSARGNLFEAGSTFGHTGFTGTMFWIDPRHDTFVILLTNAVHAPGKGSVLDLRRKVATVVAAAIIESPEERYIPQAVLAAGPVPAAPATATTTAATASEDCAPADVLCGIDVLKRDGFKPLKGRRVGVITNHTGLDRGGNRTLDLLVAAPDVKVTAVFSPEHGLFGALDEKVGHIVDEKTGLQVFSLYGETRRPTPEMLKGVDTLVFDIQDIGARFYTYIATLGNCMEEAAKAGIRVVVLDRPNPIRGVDADGPIADKNRLGFTAFGPIPVTHGMTVGELARLFNTEYGIKCDLQVIEIEGWRRDMWWDQTGLSWVNPSPNMRNLTQATLYPAIGLLEATNLSVGRGTDQPFELFGAPWIKARELAAALNGACLPGLRFVPIRFTPTSSKFAKQACEGVYIVLTDRDGLSPVASGLTIAWHLRRLYGEQFEVERVINLMANAGTLAALKTSKAPEGLPATWKTDLEKFKAVRGRYLMYP